MTMYCIGIKKFTELMFRVSGHYDHVLYYSKEVTELMFRVSGHYDRVLDWSEEVYGTDVQGLWAL